MRTKIILCSRIKREFQILSFLAAFFLSLFDVDSAALSGSAEIFLGARAASGEKWPSKTPHHLNKRSTLIQMVWGF